MRAKELYMFELLRASYIREWRFCSNVYNIFLVVEIIHYLDNKIFVLIPKDLESIYFEFKYSYPDMVYKQTIYASNLIFTDYCRRVYTSYLSKYMYESHQIIVRSTHIMQWMLYRIIMHIQQFLH